MRSTRVACIRRAGVTCILADSMTDHCSCNESKRWFAVEVNDQTEEEEAGLAGPCQKSAWQHKQWKWPARASRRLTTGNIQPSLASLSDCIASPMTVGS